MATLKIEKSDFPRLDGKVAIVTGGAAGIGLATCKLLLELGAQVHAVDLNNPSDDDRDAEDWDEWPRFKVHLADVSDWVALRGVFEAVGKVDMIFANAGIADAEPGGVFVDDEVDEDGLLAAPSEALAVIQTNAVGVMHTIKLAHHYMRKHGVQGSIVVTGSSAMYWPDPYVPVASMTWGGQASLIRGLHDAFYRDGITLNGVAVFVAMCRLVPYEVGFTFVEKGIPVSYPNDIALALLHSATASQTRRVASQGAESQEEIMVEGRWNGRIIQVFGKDYKEIEEPLLDLRDQWFSREFCEKIKATRTILYGDA